MPTIDQLEPVVVASDDDVLPVSQSGAARRVTRSQLLAGTQASLALTPGLLGRVSSGLGPPQPVLVGAGLSLANGVLSGTPQFSPARLPAASGAGLEDVVAVTQSGQDRGVSVRNLLSVGGVDISGQVARADLGTMRRLGEWLGDAVCVEAFGAIGDGITNDNAALNAAIGTGRPVLLGPKTYRVDGQWDINTAAVILGIQGISTIRRMTQDGGAWINVSCPQFVSIGVTFDAGSVAGDSWGVLVDPSCQRTVFENCSFLNAKGPTLGTGLTIQARDGLLGHGSDHSIVGCTFKENACHGLWIQAASGADVRGCLAAQNGGYGICLDFNDPTFSQTVRQSSVVDCRCLQNSRGISIGNYNSTNREPPVWGLANPDATDIVVSRNTCSGNSAYGIAVSGTRIQVDQNRIIVENASAEASGILCNASLSCVASNVVVGPGQYGIDAGGSSDLNIIENVVQSCSVGINAGGSVRVRVAANRLLANQRAVTVFQVETDGRGLNFGMACSDVWVEDNLIDVIQSGGGIFLFDGPQRVEIRRNRFVSGSEADFGNLCWAHTDAVTICDNTLNGSPSALASSKLFGSVAQIIILDLLDKTVLPKGTTRVDTVLGLHQATLAGALSFIKVISGGEGYSSAQILITGSGSGAAAGVYISMGRIIGIALLSGGSGYDPSMTSVTIVGDGQGAIAQPFVGLPPGPGRRLTIRCVNETLFPNSIAAGQTNWTLAAVTVPANTDVLLEGAASGWQATQFNSIDHILPGSDGSLAVRSSSGNITLQVGTGGAVQLNSNVEITGFLVCQGRGSPEGVVAAPPGSDYRNLDGGSGTTAWFKRSGSGSFGWFAVA